MLLLLLFFVPLEVLQWAYPHCNCTETAPFVTQIGVACSSFNIKGSKFVALGQISEKNAAMRPQTILNLVLKFQFNRACFLREEAGTWESGKKRKRKKSISGNNRTSVSLHNADANNSFFVNRSVLASGKRK